MRKLNIHNRINARHYYREAFNATMPIRLGKYELIYHTPLLALTIPYYLFKGFIRTNFQHFSYRFKNKHQIF